MSLIKGIEKTAGFKPEKIKAALNSRAEKNLSLLEKLRGGRTTSDGKLKGAR